jgi:hypothetical protein
MINIVAPTAPPKQKEKWYNTHVWSEHIVNISVIHASTLLLALQKGYVLTTWQIMNAKL